MVDFLNYFHEIDNPILSCRLVNFLPAKLDEFSHIARHIGRKSCSLDPLPSNVFLSQLDLLLPVLHDIGPWNPVFFHIPFNVVTS